MKPQFWHAIDRIGHRPVAKMDWETVTGLAWSDLSPFLVKCPDTAREVMDPDDSRQQLVVWPKSEDMVFLDSSELPAHRAGLERSIEDVALFRAHLEKVSSALASRFNFVTRPVKSSGVAFEIGFVQTPGAGNAEVLLIMPTTPGAVRLAGQRILVDYAKKKLLILLPTAKSLEFLPAFPNSVVVRVLAEFLTHSAEDSLVNVVSDISEPAANPSQQGAKSLPVRQEDRWSDLNATLNPSNGMLELRIEKRSITVRIWDTKKKKPSKDAFILGQFANKKPASWAISDTPIHEQRAMSRAFQRLQGKFKAWVRITDGEPFEYDPSTRSHVPSFKLILKK